jgi:glycosyltransferase involved in cell wall biosynthesis
MIKAIILDFGGVIYKTKWEEVNNFLFKKYMRKFDLIFSPTESITNLYKKFNQNTITYFNTYPYHGVSPVLIKNNPIKLIHHGICIPERKIEKYIELAKLLGNNYQLTLMLENLNEEYFSHVSNLSKNIENLKIIQTVSYNELIFVLSKHDVLVLLFDDKNLNYYFSLPNKLFESIQASLAIVTSPTKDISSFIKKFKIGCVSDNFEMNSMVRLIKSLSLSDINNFKIESNKISNEFCAENTQKYILDCIVNLLNNRKIIDKYIYLNN